MAVLKYARGATLETLLNTGATLANNALAVSSAITITDTGYLEADLELVVTFSVAPTASTGISVWFLREVDGTNYEDGGASVTPTRAPDCVIPVAALTTAQRVNAVAMLPPGPFKVLAKNDGTGQTMSTGWTLKVKPYSYQI